MAYITIFSHKGVKKVNTAFFFFSLFLKPQEEGEKEEGDGLG